MQKKPKWLKVKSYANDKNKEVNKLLRELSINTVCEEALCPNRGECFSKGTATFMILGKNCTRNCTFCNVRKNTPEKVDIEEPQKVAKAVEELELSHVVITSVTRDDLDDGGSGHFAKCVREIHKLGKEITIEVLIPDFMGDIEGLKRVLSAHPNILNHNIETVRRLYPEVRKEANYQRSLRVLENSKKIDSNIYTKSGIMLGLGETKNEVIEVLNDLYKVGCDFLTVGQYLSPSKKHHKVIEYIHPDIFDEYKNIAYQIGFKYVASAPFVRSSYNAKEAIDKANN